VHLVLLAYGIAVTLPIQERFVLATQITRAAVSIPASIAEGTGRRGKREFAYFLSVARGSARELDVLLEIVERLGYAPVEATRLARSLAEEISRMLTSMMGKLSR
jgi:four helix bundle protein